MGLAGVGAVKGHAVKRLQNCEWTNQDAVWAAWANRRRGGDVNVIAEIDNEVMTSVVTSAGVIARIAEIAKDC